MDGPNNRLNFESDGFKNIEIIETNDSLFLRTNVKSREDFEKWREIYCRKTNTCFNSKFLQKEGERVSFHQKLVCQHGVKKKTGQKKTFTGCPVQMDVKIRVASKHSVKKDKLIRNYPCIVKITGKHNHSTTSAEALGQLKVQSATKDEFYKYFELGMTTAQATRYHAMKLGLSNDVCGLANTSLNPSSKSIDYMRRRWLQNKHGGLNDISMINSIKKYATVNPNLAIEVEADEDSYCVALVTPFMKRVHSEFREACEVVFVDATGCVDQLNTAVVPLLCAGPAGAAPLAVLFTSSQDEVILTKGFNLVKKAVGTGAFYGKGTPQCFMTDNCDAERKALSTTWPEARLFLCIFHLQQQVWRWLLDSKHGIKKEHRQELMALMKKLVYAKCITEFSQVLEEFQCSSLADTYPAFKSYLCALVERKEEWALTFRAGMMLHGHDTNSFCESTICIIKDIVLNRCKAYNTAQLLMFMAEVFDDYMKQRLVEVALGWRRMKLVGTFSTIPTEMVTHVGGALYEVQSQSTEGCIYSVDLTVGMCTCTVGENGAPCKHQAAAAEYSMSAVPQALTLTAENRRWLAGVALGQEKLLDGSFFRR